MNSLFNHIYKVTCPCEITDASGNLLYYRGGKKKEFLVPLTSDVVVKNGSAKFLGKSENYYNVTPEPLPKGWNVSFSGGSVDRIACINIDGKEKTASVNLDDGIFNDPEIPEGCKVFMVFHEIGHLKYGPDEEACDWFACQHAMRAGVSPFLCYIAIRAFMPAHYDHRIISLAEKIELYYPHLKNES